MIAAKSAAIWKKRVERWVASGQSCKEYAAHIGVNPNTLAGWRWKLKRQAAASSAVQDDTAQGAAIGRPEFVDVTKQLAAVLANESGLIELEVGGAVVRLRGQVDAEALSKVIGVLEARR
jgi:transposase-like protein